MDSFESNTHSFIVKIWLEENGRIHWRGHITHIPGGERRYLDDLEEIARFIRPHLQAMGVSLERKVEPEPLLKRCRLFKRKSRES